MNQTLIKLSETHYIVVDDSEIKEGEWYLTFMNNEVAGEPRRCEDSSYSFGNCKKITHSTQPLESIEDSEVWEDGKYLGPDYAFQEIKYLPLAEVEEAVFGYSVEKMAKHHYGNHRKTREFEDGFILGFQIAHKELVKGKLFPVEDMINAFISGTNSGANYESIVNGCSGDLEEAENFAKCEFEDFKKSLLPKTEWNIEIINGKIKLL
jgi:hypothetical protein